MYKVQKAGINFSRDQRHIVWCKLRFVECDRQNTVRLFSITAACKQTANPPKPLCQCNGGHYKVEICPKIDLFCPTVDPACQNSSDNSSVNYKSVCQSVQKKSRILHHRIPFCDPVKKLCTDKSSQKSPEDKAKYMVTAEAELPGPVFGHDPGCDHTKCDHGTISVYGERSDCKEFVFHRLLSPFHILRSSWFARSFKAFPSQASGSHSPQTSIPRICCLSRRISTN